MDIKKILITGSSGTIGTRLCEKLIKKDYEVIGTDLNPNKWSKKINKLTIKADLRNKKEVFGKLPKDTDLIIHLAANARISNLIADPSLARDNFETIFNILEFARQNNIKKIMFSSSREVYGNSGKIKHKEKDASVQNCNSAYTFSKIGGESLVHMYQQSYGVDFIILRFSNTYGMYDNNRLIPIFIRLCKEGKDLTVFGKEKSLDFTHVDDIVDGVILCIEKFNKVKNEIFNISCGKGTSILKVAKLIKGLTGSNNKIVIKKNRKGDVVKFTADISKAKEKLGYNPKITMNHGLKKNIQWYDNCLNC